MHEMGIAQQIVEIALSSIPEKMKGHPILGVNLKIGKLSAIVPASLKFCFDIISENTLLSGAELNIVETPVRLRCMKCNCEWEMTAPDFICIRCQCPDTSIISGREMDIVSIEISDQ